MQLTDIAQAVASLQKNHSILIYGPPKTGKTRLVGTAAKIVEVRRIFWFDGENGYETLLNMGLTQEEMAKITVFRMQDSKEEPIFIETMLKAFGSKEGVKICDAHGKCNCSTCKKANAPVTAFRLSDCTHQDLVVTDSGSDLGDSGMNAACLGKEEMYKPGWDEYYWQGKWLSDILSVMQQCTHTNFVMISHEILIENDEKKDVFYPLIGTKNFSMKAAKYFGTVVYVHKKMNKHVAGSSSTYLGDRITGSRINAVIEKNGMDMKNILIEGGILRNLNNPIELKPTEVKEIKDAQEVKSEEKPKALTLAEKLALKREQELKQQKPN